MFESDFVEERSRLTTFFRLIMAIPHIIWLYIYGTLSAFAALFAWFAIIFTARYPKGLYDFVAGYNRWMVQLSGYVLLLTDNYPPFWGNVEDDYPVRLRFTGPLEKYSRAKAFFRIIIALPVVMLLSYVIQPLLGLAVIGAWFVILILGRQPRGLQETLEVGLAYTTRANAYLSLLTETYPPLLEGFGSQSAVAANPSLPGGAALTAGAPSASTPASPGSPEDPTAGR
jgi:hypothetical protein